MRIIKKLLLAIIILLVSVVVVFAIVYNTFQASIQSKILASVNESIKGEITIENLRFSLFATYPKVIVNIDEVVLIENQSESAVVLLTDIYLELDAGEALDGKYIIDDFKLGSGTINLITYSDSSMNILNAIESATPENEDEPADPLLLKLNRLSIENIQLNYTDELTRQFVSSNLQKLNSQILIDGDSLMGNVELTYLIDSITIDEKRVLRKHHLALSSRLNANLDQLLVGVSNGIIKLDLLEANINGIYNDADNGFVDFAIWAKHTDLSELAKMDILKEENLPDIRHGELEINATIIGYTKDQLPIIHASVRLSELQLYNRFGKMIDNAGFDLKFTSNSTRDLMDSHLVADSIFIDFSSGGFIKGSAVVNDFIKPRFDVAWEASEKIENLDKWIKISDVKSMSGKVSSKGDISGIYSLKSNTLLEYKGKMNAKFSNSKIVLKDENYPISDINGTVYLNDGDAGIDNFTLIANSNELALDGKFKNFLPFVLGKPTQLSATISVKSAQLNTETLLAFDKTLADSNKYIINDLDVSIQADLSSRALANYELIPTGKLTFLNFTALVDGAPPIANFSGVIEADENLVSIKDFKGIIGKSQVDFSIAVSNYADFLQTNTTEQMIIDVSLKSEKANAKDFFTINHKFVLPRSYEEEVLKNVVINAKIITTNTELQKTDLIPEFELQLTGMQFQTVYSPVVFKNIFVFGLIQDNNVYINSMFGKFGRSDVFMNAQFDNVVATKDTISRPIKSRISFNAGVLDLNELVKLEEAEVEEDTIKTQTETSNPFAEDFPITDFQVNIGELVYFDAVIKNLKGIINIGENNKIKMQQVSLQSGEFGSFEFDGTLDASSHEEAILKSTIKISDVDLSNLNVTYFQNGEEVKISDHFRGKINGEVVADVPIAPDFSFDLARLTGKIKVKMTDGALINYAPLEEMGKYFKNKDLNYIEFDELKNTMIFNGGKMLLPFMTINTTLGTINLMGYQTVDYDMSYDIQVPIKLVAGSALNSLFASKKGDDDKKDEVKKSGKGKYITVHISGKEDQYKFKLGKKHVLTAPPGFSVD